MVDTVQSKGAGIAFDPSFDEPAVYLISVGEICLASLYATIPFFWPFVVGKLSRIFVKYEFDISSEARRADDEFELRRAGSPRGNPPSLTSDKNEMHISEHQAADTTTRDKTPSSKASHYADEYIQYEVVNFAPEIRGALKGTSTIVTSENPLHNGKNLPGK
jgi:hypothetical protein